MAVKEPSAMVFGGVKKKHVIDLQRMKNRGEKITMVGTAACDPLWVAACERAGVDLVRYVAPGEDSLLRIENNLSHTHMIRQLAPSVCTNIVMHSEEHTDPITATKYGTRYMTEGADSVFPIGVTNECLEYLTKNHIPVIGHVGLFTDWKVGLHGGYIRIGKTAEDALGVWRMAYEYQECGMKGMTIEMTSAQVTNAIAKKLRVPVINVAAGGVADGSELVIFDLLGFQPRATMPKHAKCYREFFDEAIKAFSEFKADVDSEAYPAPEHGWNMDEKEFDKFMNELEQKY
ncbi:MAG: 3-methyl-2-oxobutanoate hydroxymethyltransferase [Clostridiales Family XIII bacterium]|jgi:3-methyl-2-oxobutanoate hydroxymethyltransferase|nr:3-methyl-2-oxobutanoate hydroxymethyltransferase [Clostridiales Family XIII bacterium]